MLGEFVLPRAEPVWTQVLLDVLGRLGVESKCARQALARTAAEGLLASDRAGRRVRWSLTTSGRDLLLTDGAARIYGFGGARPVWDGRWLVLLISVPESRRRLRHRLRTRLAWAGLGSPAPGVWLTPDPTKQDEVAGVVADLELTEVTSSFVGPFGAIGTERDVVAQAWDLAGVEAAYEDFLAEFGAGRPDHAGRGARPADPPGARLAPLPVPRSPAARRAAARRLGGGPRRGAVHRQHTRWHQPAQQRWQELAASTG